MRKREDIVVLVGINYYVGSPYSLSGDDNTFSQDSNSDASVVSV